MPHDRSRSEKMEGSSPGLSARVQQESAQSAIYSEDNPKQVL